MRRKRRCGLSVIPMCAGKWEKSTPTWHAIQFYIDNYGKETFVIKKKEKERAEYIRSEDIDDIKDEVIEAATNEARKEVIRLLGGVISGMNVGQPVIMQAANSEAQEPTEDVMDDADVAGLAMGWMSKGD